MKKAIIFDFNRTLYDPDTGKLMDNALEVLRALKQADYKMFLIGKGTEERTNLIQELGLGDYFNEIIVKEEKVFNDFLRLKNSLPDHEFYSIGDRIKKEIKYSNQVGCKTVWFKKGKFAAEGPSETDEQPWKEITDLSSLLAILPLE